MQATVIHANRRLIFLSACAIAFFVLILPSAVAMSTRLGQVGWSAEDNDRRVALAADQASAARSASVPVLVARSDLTVTSVVYLPVVMQPSIDLTIGSLEATQSVQTPNNGVPMVAGRSTVVRIYAQTSSTQPVSGVRVSLAASRNGSPLSGSPLILGPGSVSTAPSRGVYTSSFNALLPSAWLSGKVTLLATVDSSNVVFESNESNNTAAVTLDFNSVPALSLKIVPINYTHTPNGHTYPGPATDTISDWIMRSYPLSAINTSFHPSVNFTGNLGNGSDWSSLLNLVSNLKDSEGAPNAQVYYALVPIKNGSDVWFHGGISGIGWIGWRASVGLELPASLGWGQDATGQNAAHEIGHNLGRQHAPCGGPSGVDPNYPYANASIGQYGLDISKSRIWSPVAPDNTKDLMSYCGPAWLSDYNYQGLYNNQRAVGLSVNDLPVTNSLLIRATVKGDGAPTLLPAYSLRGSPTLVTAPTDYAIELLDQQGNVIASDAVTLLEAEENGIVAHSIHAVVPRPAQPIAKLRVLRSGRLVAERVFNRLAPRLAAQVTVEQATHVLTLHWGEPDVPALVRYTVDDGKSWTTLGLDVLGGGLTLDPRLLPGGAGRFEITLADSDTPLVLTATLQR
jgi:hypothetical protein